MSLCGLLVVLLVFMQSANANPFEEAKLLIDFPPWQWIGESGDFNGDRREDLVVCRLVKRSNDSPYNYGIGISYQQPDGTFESVVETFLDVDSSARMVVIGDFNEDGRDDLLLGNTPDGKVQLWISHEDGFVRGTEFEATQYGLAAGDLDADGHLDIVTNQSPSDQNLELWYGNGCGGFDKAHEVEFAARVIWFEVEDFDGDGAVDILVGSPAFSLWMNRGKGVFEETQAISALPIASISFGDVNGDRVQDVTMVQWSPNNPPMLSQSTYLLGNGDGTFEEPVVIASWYDVFARSTLAVDFNGDSRADPLFLVNVPLGEPPLLLALTQPGGSLVQTYVPFEAHPAAAAAMDMNQDGYEDLLVSAYSGSSYAGAVWLFMNKGAATTVAIQRFEVYRSGDLVQLAWSLSHNMLASLLEVGVQRSLHGEGPFFDVVRGLRPQPTMSWEEVSQGSDQYWYRLLLVRQDGSQTRSQTLAAHPEVRTNETRLLSATQIPGGKVRLRYEIAGADRLVNFALYDVRGRLAWKVEAGVRRGGLYDQTWDLRNQRRESIGRGVYLVQMQVGHQRFHRKLLVQEH